MLSFSTQHSPLSPIDSDADDDEPYHSDSTRSQPDADDFRCPDCDKTNKDGKARKRHYATRMVLNLVMAVSHLG